MLSFLRPVMLVTLLLSVTPSAVAGDRLVTEILPIHYRTPQELLPLLAPLVESSGSLAATGDRLIVTTTQDNLRQIKDILGAIDRPPKDLLVSVHYGESHTMDGHAAEAAVQIGEREQRLSTGSRSTQEPIGEATTVQSKPYEPRVAVQLWRTRTASDGRRDQHVRVIEGSPACISRGQLAPFGRQDVLFIHGAPMGIEAGTQYVNLSTGFCVVPHLRGDRVLLDIAPQSAHASLGDTGTVETKAIRTTVSLPLGQWVEIGGINRRHGAGERGRHWSTRTTEVVFVKVDEVSP